MANISELDLLGRKFIDLEIEILNDTNTSIFENGIYNNKYLEIEEWDKGIKTFLMYEGYKTYKDTPQENSTRLFYRSLAELVNKAYMRYKEILGNVDRLSLKAYLQIVEILEQEQKIIDIERYQSSQEVIEAQENLNKIVLNSYNKHLKMIQDVTDSAKLKNAIETVIAGKDKKEIREAFDDSWWRTFEHLNEILKPENKNKLEAEIEEAQAHIKEATLRQQEYDKQKEKRKKLDELKKDKNEVVNFFNNKSAVDSTIQVLNDCCDYFYTLMYLREFMASLDTLEIHNQFYFMNPFELMSYDKLQGGLMDLMALLDYKKINNEKFVKIANKFIDLEFLDSNKQISYEDKEIELLVKEYKKVLLGLKKRLELLLTEQNGNNTMRNVLNLENEFIHTLRKVGW